jgi:hypothetical protein
MPAAAFKTSLHRGDRVGVVRPFGADGEFESGVAVWVSRHLQRELKERGIDAVDTRLTLDELRRDGARDDADYYIEVVRSDADARAVGGVGVGNYNVGVDVSVVVARVAAELRLYDGHTLELLDTYDMNHRSTAVLPTSVGIGGRHAGLWVALPFIQAARYRAAARAVAEDAAEAIVLQARRDSD